ncbi:AAA family ATPase [Mycolicibacterium mageritense]|uniref:AAA family ATPase n=1 Tax=Mycolicibacterium mageritense TaxID=53462 RepID=UPI0011D8C8F5|nr:AAA family ATPase [Mycolicibacterium mageritense]TXI59497.1 MAG: AAA family ATPase [Mycolicibacterium mageritense]
MAVKHRKSRARAKKIATLGAATATVTALTAGVAPLPVANAGAVQKDVDLQADFRPFPPPDQIPDLTGGLGTQVYNFGQDIGAQAMTAFVENFNLLALLQAVGIDPTEALTDALNQALGGAIGGSGLEDLTVDLTPVLEQLGDELGIGPLIGSILQLGVIPTDLPLGDVIALLGVDLSNPLDITEKAGIKLITSGGPFTLLRLLGVDLGWTPPFPNSVADEINSTPYLQLGMVGLLNALGVDTTAIDAIDALIKTYNLTHPSNKLPLLTEIPDAIQLRVPIVAGWGFGAFAAGAAYQQVVDDLPNQPGGANYTGTDPLLGSFTILPMILIDNPGRANGGILARFYPIFGLVGIDTVTPDTQVQSSTDGEGPLNGIQVLGLTLGGANLIPIKIDATAEYLPLSDFAAWPNPFTMANNVAAGMFPTYILRNQTVDGILTDLVDQVGSQALADITDYLAYPGDDPTKGPKLNIYYTLDAQSLPLLEPTYLAFDVINLLTGANLNNPIGTALSPALTTLVNIGYTDVRRVENPDGTVTYVRDFDDSDVPTAFGSFPELDWSKVPGDVATQLVQGVQKAVSDGFVNQNPVPGSNVLATLLSLLGVGNSLPLSGSGLDLSSITDALNALSGGLPSPLSSTQGITTTSFEPQGITSTGTDKTGGNLLNLNAVTDNLPDLTGSTKDAGDTAKQLSSTENESDSTPQGSTKTIKEAADEARGQVEKSVTDATTRVKSSAEKARAQTEKAVKDAQDRVNKVAENGRKQVENAVKGVEKAVKDTTDKVKNATAPKEKADSKDSDAKSDSKDAA